MAVTQLQTENSNDTQQAFLVALVGLLFIHILMLNSQVNQSLFYLLNQSHLWIPESVIAMINDLGNGITMGAVALCYLVRYPQRTGKVLLAALLSLVMVPLLKHYFDAPRPAAMLSDLHIIGQAHYSNSFPSGHTATIFLFAGLYYLHKPNTVLRVAALMLALVVGGSRVAAGAHWPQDVALGAIVGLLCAFVASRCCTDWQLNRSRQSLCF